MGLRVVNGHQVKHLLKGHIQIPSLKVTSKIRQARTCTYRYFAIRLETAMTVDIYIYIDDYISHAVIRDVRSATG